MKAMKNDKGTDRDEKNSQTWSHT